MVKAVETASVGWSIFHPCSTVVYPAPRINMSAVIGIDEALAHFCSLVMDCHVIKVASCLVCKCSECGRTGWWRGIIQGGHP